MRNLESVIPQLIANVKHEIYARPLFLGGATASGGGIGGPPGGFIGYLPQTRIAFDLSEDATLYIPESGASLLDNLNRIRYRIKNNEDDIEDLDSRVTTIEQGGVGGGIEEVRWSGNVISTEVKKLDFHGNVILKNVDDIVMVCVPELITAYYSGITGNSISISGAVKINLVYKNGMLLFENKYTISGITVYFNDDLVSTDEVSILYLKDCFACNSYGNGDWGSNWGGIC